MEHHNIITSVTRLLKRCGDAIASFAAALDFSVTDYYVERISYLEKEVEMLKAKLQQVTDGAAR